MAAINPVNGMAAINSVNVKQLEYIKLLLKDDKNIPALEMYMENFPVNAETAMEVFQDPDFASVDTDAESDGDEDVSVKKDGNQQEGKHKKCSQIEERYRELCGLKDPDPPEMKELKTRITEVMAQNTTLTTQVAELTTQNTELTTRVAELTTQVAELKTHGIFGEQINELKANYAKNEKAHNEYIVNNYTEITFSEFEPLLADYEFEIYRSTFQRLDDKELEAKIIKQIKFKNLKSVFNVIVVYIGSRIIDDIDDMVRFIDKHHFTDYKAIATEFMDKQYYNSPQLRGVIELFRIQRVELDFEKTVEIASARYILDKYNL